MSTIWISGNSGGWSGILEVELITEYGKMEKESHLGFTRSIRIIKSLGLMRSLGLNIISTRAIFSLGSIGSQHIISPTSLSFGRMRPHLL